jgi:hypothetical protein
MARYPTLLALSFVGALAVFSSGSAGAEVEINGPLEADQTPAVSVLAEAPPEAPTQVSAGGGTATYPTRTWSPESSDTPSGVQVVTVTASGTWALTGIAVNQTGQPISGANVTLSPEECQLECPPPGFGPLAPGGPSPLTTTTNAGGTFAFVDVSLSTPWKLTVNASGYGLYTAIHFAGTTDLAYETTVKLSPSTQLYDLSLHPSGPAQVDVASTPVGYASQTRVPPSIRVAMYNLDSDCNPTSSSYQTLLFPWRYYILQVAAAEIPYFDWGIAAVKANFQAESSYAWFWRLGGGPPDIVGDVTNTTRFQCFLPGKFVPDKWESWVDDVLDERVKKANGDVQETQYREGTESCSEPSPLGPDDNHLSQFGSHHRETSCGATNWRAIDQWYYTGTVVAGLKPTTPSTSFTRPPNAIAFDFKSLISNGGSLVSKVGWRYTLERTYADGWHEIYKKGWDWDSRSVPTAFTYYPSGGTCAKYRVKAWNPVGETPYANYNAGNLTCPG